MADPKPDVLWRVEKRRYSPDYRWNPSYRERVFLGWRMDKKTIDYRTRLSDVTLAINYAKKANLDARSVKEKYPNYDGHGTFYYVKATPIYVVATGDPSVEEIPVECMSE